MLRRLLTAACAVVLPLSFLPGAAATPSVLVAPPAGAISPGVQFLANIPELASAISIDFLGNTMFASTVTGIYAYDVSDPAAPTLVGAHPMYIWENEDVQIDQKRKLLFLSRDPRGFTSPATTAFPYGAVQVIDISIPAAMHEISVSLLPSGHTTTCVDNCNYTWTAGPATGATQSADWGGRPVFALDMRDPANPKQCPHAIDEHRNDGKTDYTHDVQVDKDGIAWISGSGGIRGYWVNGTHRNAQTGKMQKATGCDPVPYAGGGTDLGQLATADGVMHNSLHPAWNKSILMATEEVTVTNCAKSGKFATYSLDGSYGGAGFRSTPAHKFRLKVLDTWTPEKQPGSTGCDSAHYFTDRGDGITANAFYTQGTRFLDVRDPKHIKQVAYYRPDDADTWAAYWRPGGYVFVADFQRGVDVLKVTIGKNGKEVAAPPVPTRSIVNLPSRDFGWMCQVPASVAATRPELAGRV
ncbi:MAG: hypothetical protein QOI82_2034 [Actinomycetota bacterium]|nr:hypothetical protein [Actinomycetota bacterium]